MTDLMDRPDLSLPPSRDQNCGADAADGASPRHGFDREGAAARLFARAPDSAGFQKLRKRLARQTAEAIRLYGMAQPGADGARPRWMVCLSGGKDSWTLLSVLLDLRAQGALDVDLIAGHLDQGQPGYEAHVLPDFLAALDMPRRIERRDTFSVVTAKIPEGKTYCSLCSRLRRANLYRMAREEGCGAIVLGHHADDALETFFLNLFHGAKLAAMPPKLLNDEGDLLTLRPLIQSEEADIARFSAAMRFPITPCNLCGSQEGAQRKQIKAMLAEWERAHPGRKQSMAAALASINPSHMLDPDLFDFAALRPGGQAAG